jgi:hypothetical protein
MWVVVKSAVNQCCEGKRPRKRKQCSIEV